MQIKFVAHYFKNAFQSRPLFADISAALLLRNNIQIMKVYQFEKISREQRKWNRCKGVKRREREKNEQIFDQFVCYTNNYFTK